jgi:hypothetical protein
MTLDLAPAFPLADSPAQLADFVLSRLLVDADTPALRNEIVNALSGIPVPALNKWGSNQGQIDKARWQRVYAAALLAAVSNEFLVQK